MQYRSMETDKSHNIHLSRIVCWSAFYCVDLNIQQYPLVVELHCPASPYAKLGLDADSAVVLPSSVAGKDASSAVVYDELPHASLSLSGQTRTLPAQIAIENETVHT
eukprot:5097303-Amphidinium_carterae.1